MTHVTKVADAAALAGASSTLFACAAVVVEQTLPTLDRERRDAIGVAVANGATLCVEASVDNVGTPRAVLTVVKIDGMRHEVASVFAADRTRRAR